MPLSKRALAEFIGTAALLYVIASGTAGFELSGGLASNGYSELWLFWLAPLVGAALAGLVYRVLAADGSRR